MPVPRLLLVLPSHFDRRGKLITAKKASSNVNLNLPTIAGLTPPPWEVRIVNDYVHPVDGTEPADLVAITVLTTAAPRAYQLADAFRARGVKVVLGGFHVWALPEEAAAHADALVIGEAEDLWPGLLDDFRAGTLRERYVVDRPPDLAGRPAPRYDLVNPRDYQLDLYPVESGRGCPNSCDYCAVTAFHGGRHRHRPVADVLRNIRATGSRFLSFSDDNLVGDPDYALELFRAMAPLNVRFMGTGAMTIADNPPLLDAAVAAGLRFMWVGVETLERQALVEVHRPINQVDEFARRIAALTRRGVIVGGNMMFGFDSDTPDTYERAYEFFVRNKVFPFLFVMTPMPGTRLHARMAAAGRLLTTDWSRYTGFETVFQPKNFTAAEQDDRYYDLATRLFATRHNFARTLAGIRLRNLKEDFFIRLGAFLLGAQVGRAARRRLPDYW